MKKTIGIIALVLTSAAILVFLYFFLSFNGGLQGWLSNQKRTPDWNSSNITQARNQTKEEMATLQTDLKNRMGFNDRGNSFHDQCVKGVHDLLRNDPFAYRCTYRITHYYSFNGDFRSKLLDLETVLASENWQGTSQNDPKPISKMIREYYDDKTDTNYGRTGLVSSLPTVELYKVNSSDNLSINYAQKETTNLDQITYLLSGSGYNQVYSQGSQTDVQSIFKIATKNDKYFLAISVEEEYFEN